MIVNFGRNTKFEPNQFVEPQSEAELLQLLSSNIWSTVSSHRITAFVESVDQHRQCMHYFDVF